VVQAVTLRNACTGCLNFIFLIAGAACRHLVSRGTELADISAWDDIIIVRKRSILVSWIIAELLTGSFIQVNSYDRKVADRDFMCAFDYGKHLCESLPMS
jgi:hypothetical protein